MVNNSSENTPRADYKLDDTWFEPDSTPPSSDITTPAISSSETSLLVPEGDLPQPDNTSNFEGGQTTPPTTFEI